MSCRSLIFGISGQDGFYLRKHLESLGHDVHGTSRNSELKDDKVYTLFPQNKLDVERVIKRLNPAHIYILCGPSSVGRSFDYPADTYGDIINATINILEAAFRLNPHCRAFNASSTECFGNNNCKIDEETKFAPVSPYGEAKVAAARIVTHYRENLGFFAANGFMSNHESPRRRNCFVFKKIIAATQKIAAGRSKRLVLGNLSVVRDWGWAEEFVEAMPLILNSVRPQDYIIASGNSYSLEKVVELAFFYHGLDWKEYVEINDAFLRPNDVKCVKCSVDKIKKNLGWVPTYFLHDMIRQMNLAMS